MQIKVPVLIFRNMDLVLDSPSAASSDHSNMLNVEARLATFSDWPLQENCVCTPERMAAAGFYSCGGDMESDLVSCFHCHKVRIDIDR